MPNGWTHAARDGDPSCKAAALPGLCTERGLDPLCDSTARLLSERSGYLDVFQQQGSASCLLGVSELWLGVGWSP